MFGMYCMLALAFWMDILIEHRPLDEDHKYVSNLIRLFPNKVNAGINRDH